MLMYTREGTTVTQQEKLKTKPDNRWTIKAQIKALLCSILSVVEKASLVICNGPFSFSHRKDKRVRHELYPATKIVGPPELK